MAFGNFLYIRPDEMWSLNGAVAASSSTPLDTDYQAAWLTDGRPGRPIRSQSVNFKATITNAAATVNIVALVNHNVNVTTAITGDVVTTIPAPTQVQNGIFLNSYVQLTASSSAASGYPSSSASTLTAVITGNLLSVTVGELIAGKSRILFPGPALKDQQRADDDFSFQDQSEFSSLFRYDRGVERRAFSFTQYYSETQFNDLQAWQRAQRAASQPSLIIPDATLNDAWSVHLASLTYKKQAPATYAVTMQFLEYPRSRW